VSPEFDSFTQICAFPEHLSGLIEVTYPLLLNLILKNNLNYFSLVAFAKVINLATPINLLTHYAKGTPSYITS